MVGVAQKPLFAFDFKLPLGGRNQAQDFSGKINVHPCGKSHLLHPKTQFIDADNLPEFIEKGIGRAGNGPDQADIALRPSILVKVPVGIGEGPVRGIYRNFTGIFKSIVFVNLALLKGGNGDNGFENRTRVILPADGPVKKRQIGVIQCLCRIFRIKSGGGIKSQNLTGGVGDNSRPLLAA